MKLFDGKITDVKKGTSKSGNPYCILTLALGNGERITAYGKVDVAYSVGMVIGLTVTADLAHYCKGVVSVE